MGRMVRNNVDYFPHPVKHGRKMYYIECKYGNDGYATWLKLLEELGDKDYHFIDMRETVTVKYLTARCGVTEEKLIQIINDLVDLGEFNREFWQHKIIVDEKFNKSIDEAYRKRNNKIITLDELSVMLKLTPISSGRNTQVTVFPPEEIHNTGELPRGKGAGNTQRKEKKRKEEKRSNRNLMSEISETEIPDDTQYLKIAFNFWKLFRKITIEADSKPTVIDKAVAAEWETQVRLMLTKNEVTADELRKIYRWLDERKTKGAQFWAENIKSTKKLRIQIPQILERMNSEKKKEPEQPSHIYKPDKKETTYPGVIRKSATSPEPQSIKLIASKKQDHGK